MKSCIYLIIIFLLAGCVKDKVEDFAPTPYYVQTPYYFPEMDVPSDNPLTEEGINLGRHLYYDKILHPQQLMSCSSCHNQSTGFTTEQSNSLPHINLGWNHAFLWNGKVEGQLEDIMLFEVEEFFQTDLNLIRNHPDYPLRYFKAFGTYEINSMNTAYALAQFFRVLNSTNSKYDQMIMGIGTMTPEEWDGYDIFFSERGDCFHCHGGALLTDNLFHNNGLDNTPDDGRFVISMNYSDLGKFKSPTLRNIELTGPYMHDGRYQTLEEVVSFYSTGLQWSETIDPLMKSIGSGGVNLTIAEQQHLVAFLKTFTDQTFLTDSHLSTPF